MVELMVILVVVGILLAIGIPALLGSRERSQDRSAQSSVSNVFSIEKVIYSGHAAYTDDPVALKAEEPTYTYVAVDTPAVVGPVYVYLAAGNVLYISAMSVTGTCFYLRDAGGAGTDFAKSASCTGATTQTYGPVW
jgi:type IV pilus assembly protein PilA